MTAAKQKYYTCIIHKLNVFLVHVLLYFKATAVHDELVFSASS